MYAASIAAVCIVSICWLSQESCRPLSCRRASGDMAVARSTNEDECLQAVVPKTPFPQPRDTANTYILRCIGKKNVSLTRTETILYDETRQARSGASAIDGDRSYFARLLLDVANYIDPENPAQLRFTGGWVRDALLGVKSHDIDVAIDNMTGYQFGLKMKEYLDHPANVSKYGLGASRNGASSDVVSVLHKIEANPEKSKHLETVTTRILGLDVDLVNLRKESYSEDSRNPQMELGTPTEDALRRDATINAMFYNIQTGLVEDFTGRGFEDLRSGIIRTPLEPYQTFKDDPLRVLRLIRFASRLEYDIEPRAREFMGNEEIKAALRAKISRERVGVEIEKTLKDPTTTHSYTPDTMQWPFTYEFTATFLNGNVLPDVAGSLAPDDEARYLVWVLTAMAPFDDAPVLEPVKPGGKLPSPMIVIAAREGIRASNKVADLLLAAHKNHEDIIAVKDAFLKAAKSSIASRSEPDVTGRDTLGMAIRRWGATWRLQCVFALLLEVTRLSRDDRQGRLKLFAYAHFISKLQQEDLMDAYDFKTLIDGKALAKALDVRPGPWMKEALEVVMAWQLRNPGSNDSDAAIEAVKHMQGRKAIPRPGQTNLGDWDDEEITKPWKDSSNKTALDLLTWSVHALNPSLIERNWPLVVPPILALLDDIDSSNKTLGCTLLTALLKSTDESMLRRTGLGPVFEDAITPCFSFLPTLTPEDESINLLAAAYPVFFAVAFLRFRSPQQNSQSSTLSHQPSETQPHHLIKLLHEHLLPSITHLRNTCPDLIAALLSHTSTLIGLLGSAAISQLTHLVPLVREIVTQPFATASPVLVIQTLKLAQTVIANAWSRVWYWRGDVLDAVCTLFLALKEEEERWRRPKRVGMVKEDVTAEDMRVQLVEAEGLCRVTVDMLRSAIKAVVDDRDRGGISGGLDENIDFEAEIAMLVAADDGLKELFER
ncbi:hypothetical protein MRB53_037817 [Persea americana]|nr:hypothetical protein MRB53_037817 [Persea americana]